jgi:hypothetical protein
LNVPEEIYIFFTGTSVSYTSKPDHHDTTESLLGTSI